MASKSKSGKDGETTSSSVTKGEVITVRLSPKLKYALELLSRTQHRTQSAVVTWAIQEAINTDHGLLKTNTRGTKISVDNMLEVLWAVHPADRLVKLAKHWPELMTYEEEFMVESIIDNDWGWPKKGDKATKELRNIWSDLFFCSETGEWMMTQEPDWDAMRK